MSSLKSSMDWLLIRNRLVKDYAFYVDQSGSYTCDSEVSKIIYSFESLIPPISKAEVVARTSPKYWKLTALLKDFNSQLQDVEELFLIRLMTR